MEDIVFEKTKEDLQCACEFTVDGNLVKCVQDAFQTVLIPAGLEFVDGKLKNSSTSLGWKLSICRSHKNQLLIESQNFPHSIITL